VGLLLLLLLLLVDGEDESAEYLVAVFIEVLEAKDTLRFWDLFGGGAGGGAFVRSMDGAIIGLTEDG